MFITKGYGFSITDIDNSCPKEIEYYEKAYKQEIEQYDLRAWIAGQYTYVAFGSVLSQAFSSKNYRNDKKSNSYPEKPFMQQAETHEMTKEEFDALSQEERDRVFMQMIENSFANTLDSFKKKKESEGGKNG